MRVKKCKEVGEKQTEKIGYTGLDKEKRRSQKNMKKILDRFWDYTVTIVL